jgi:diguanylate cyclase (GGDEF)-like protein
MAGYDPVTGLPNRYGFAELARDLVAAARPDALVGLCYLDLEPTGPVDDRLIVALAQRLGPGLDRSDTLLARFGHHEFAVLVSGPELLPGAAARVAGDLLHLLATPFPTGGRELAVAANIGVVERVAAETTYEDLLHAVDLRMRQGRTSPQAGWIAVDLDHAKAMVRVR